MDKMTGLRMFPGARVLAAATVLLLFSAAVASACNIPVYRYAIERWKPDPYEFYVLHTGPLTGADRKLVDELAKYADDIDCPTNFSLQAIDLAKEVAPWAASTAGLLAHSPLAAAASLVPGRADERVLYLLRGSENSGGATPLLMIRYPERYSLPVMWTGPLDSKVVYGFFDSPVRRELARRLLDGQTAVWLMIDSGNKKADDEAAAALTASFGKLHKDLKLPVLTDNPEDQLLNPSAPKLRIEFSLLRVSRKDAQETQLIHMLLQSEEGLTEITEPIVFAIFGRGSAMPAFAGAGITDAYGAQKEVGEFLVGPCSCQVKGLNPGRDLLMTANWGEIEGPKLTGISEFLSAAMKQANTPGTANTPTTTGAAKTSTPAPLAQTEPVGDTERPPWPLARNVVIAIGAGLVLLAVAPLLLRIKKARS